MLAVGSAGGRMLASGSADDIVTEAPPDHLLHKPCGEAMPWAKQYHEWWGQARVIVHRRVHGSSHPARREAARRRYEATGRWGWGPGW